MVSRHTEPSFVWREVCLGWRLADETNLQVIQEQMPPATSELVHTHARATQVYFVLDGEATVDLDGRSEVLRTGDAVVIQPRTPHRISNRSEQRMEFLVISSSPTSTDREDLE